MLRDQPCQHDQARKHQKGASFAATQFFADIEGVPGDPRVDARSKSFAAFQTNGVRLLGSYAQARKRG